MAAMFGHAWTSSHGIADDGTWQKGLADMSVEEIRTGLAACLKWTERFPPNLPQFRHLCQSGRKEACHEIFQALPEPAEAKAKRLAHGLEAIRGIRESIHGKHE